MSNPDEEAWQTRARTFQGFEEVVKKFTASDVIPMRLHDLRNLVEATKHLPAGAGVMVAQYNPQQITKYYEPHAVRWIEVYSKHEVPTYSENPHAGDLEEQVP